MKTIICPKCGTTISDDSNGCIYCGISKSTIDGMIKSNEFDKKAKGKNKRKNKNMIIFLEIASIIIIIAIYYKLFIPQILDYTKTEKLINRIHACEENYNGKWNYESDSCDTEDIGTINIE